jgi:hypothetical protein
MNDPDEVLRHRRRAQLCIEISAKMSDAGHRVALLEMAKEWLTLADTIESKRPGGGARLKRDEPIPKAPHL